MTTPADIEKMIVQTALHDRSAFSALYDATSAKLLGVCLRVLNNRSEAEEVLQEVYIRVWQRADSYTVTGHSPMTWLITVARNLAIDRLRARKTPTKTIDVAVDLADDKPGPEDAAIANSENAKIDSCMRELEPEHAAAVRRVYLEGETYKTLADSHKVPLNTMRTWLRRSLLKLRDCLTR
ncbi:sigma-70 family RNA polymerase sigma factor [Rhodobacteraceae bacterium]|nr:sigma-70 family RNA polymerase sigma factor [Paracoccaceae bacterium]